MITRIIKSILMLACLAILAGCGGSNKVVDAPPTVNTNSCVEEIKADVYIDGTYSIAGYVNFPGTTVFVDAVKSVERTIASTWKKDTIQYIKFGDENRELNRQEFLKIDNVAFYDQLNTSLEEVISETDESKLSVIVTDLFQTNQDIDSLMLEIKRKILSDPKKAFALVGLRSQFKGTIYDVGKNLMSFDYQSTNSSETFRPFYLLILGDEINVRTFLDAYKIKYPECKISMYSKNIGVTNTLEEDVNAMNRRSKEDKAKPMAKITNLVQDGDVLQYRLKLKDPESLVALNMNSKNIIVSSNGTYKDFYVNIDAVEKWTNINGDDVGFMFGLFDKKKKSSQKFEFVDIEAKNLADIKLNTISFKQKEEVKGELEVRLRPIELSSEEAVYRVIFSILPSKELYLADNNIFEDWNVEDSTWETIPFSELGSKTLNISKFNKMLAEMNYEINKPGFHDMYIYLNTKD